MSPTLIYAKGCFAISPFIAWANARFVMLESAMAEKPPVDCRNPVKIRRPNDAGRQKLPVNLVYQI